MVRTSGVCIAAPRDVTDSGVDARTGQSINDIQVILTNEITRIEGNVISADRKQVLDYVVVVFSTDESKWIHPLNRYIAVARADADGHFSISGLPDGDYFAVAVEYVDYSIREPKTLKQLSKFSSRLRLVNNEKRRVVLQLPLQS